MLTRRIIKKKKTRIHRNVGILQRTFFLHLDGSIARMENGRKFRRYNNMLNPIRLKWLTIRDSRRGMKDL